MNPLYELHVKSILSVIACYSFLIGISNAKENVDKEINHVPLIVSPPSSVGINQGFSRKPVSPFFCKQKSILVYECITQTKRKRKEGNNTVFKIVEYYIAPNGKDLRKTTYCIFEGSSEIKNIDTEIMQYVSDFTFRQEVGDGAYCLYSIEFNKTGRLESVVVTCYDSDSSMLNSYKLYSL